MENSRIQEIYNRLTTDQAFAEELKKFVENKNIASQEEDAAAFVEFAKTPQLMVEDIIDKNYDYGDIPNGFDAKYALALSLRWTSIDQIQQVREFINKELGAEILSMFDVIWVGQDDEKAIYLASLPKLSNSSSNPGLAMYSDDEWSLPF